MAETKPDGGQAFPSTETDADGPYNANPGMTLRDAFAIAALQGILSNAFTMERYGGLPEQIATECWIYADAMIAERDK